MEISSQTTCSQPWTYVAGRRKPRNPLKAGSTFNANKFYAKALILQWKTQQMSPDSVPATKSSRFPVMLDAGDEVKQLLYCFSLLISPERSNHCRGNSRSAGGTVTACALREQSLAKGVKKYTLYAAMNKGIGTQDEKHVLEVARWVQSRDSEISEIYQLVFDHLSSRIESYLDCISSDFDDVTVLSTYPWTEKLVELHGALSKAYDSGKERCDDWRARLDHAAEFVMENRKHANDELFCLSDSSKFTKLEQMWDEIERLSRIPIAIQCLIAFRHKIINPETFQSEQKLRAQGI
ncbi:hypothetical protein PFICI_07745 [Pestalotiopsis fici W106-1]|uniref:Uncharacterized protein n=1 Tax=Pestalotiopsis fici (strain W106-1 / CGMCC3.15140) TaxID=1229662 RepID=W3X4X1_PESFW|nr:uncharacterized protein PFICI_07745 [Pestalotiopsis fici W106-1]ETS80216.1 hypothetical protein PFICI_07745 [Pestalotiopsis fici W106-1]